MDPLVIDTHWFFRWILVSCIIVPFRSGRSAKKYWSIWREEGSPLLHYSTLQAERLSEEFDFPVALGMNYGKPDVQSAARSLVEQGVREVLCFPLYPHYALSSYEALVQKVKHVFSKYPDVHLKMAKPFYANPGYINSLASLMQKNLPDSYDHILFSYHGIPESHIQKADPTGLCKLDQSCCETISPAHEFCYRAQLIRTTRLVASRLNLPSEKYSISFQSRLGREPWLSPFTDHVIPQLARRDVRDLVVLCPSFTSDCLETLEEIGIQAKKDFISSGGRELHLMPCLNEDPVWIKSMAKMIREIF